MEKNYIGTVTLTEPYSKRSGSAIFSQGNKICVREETDKEYVGDIFEVDFKIPVKVPKDKCTSLEKI